VLTGHEPDELATGMRALLDAPVRLETMSAASRELGRGLTAAAMRDNYLAVYRQAIAGR
jgi:hypothetical protein